MPADAPVGRPLALAAKAEWLVCRETCIPEEAVLDLEIPVAERADPYPQWGSAIAVDARRAAAHGAGLARVEPRRGLEGRWSR